MNRQTNEGMGKLLTATTIKKRYGVGFVRAIGFLPSLSDHMPTQNQIEAAEKLMADTSNAGVAENIGLNDMAQRTNDDIGDIMRDYDTDETGQLLLRHLRVLDHTLITIRGNLTVQELKKVAMQQHNESCQERLKNVTYDDARRILEHDVQKADGEISVINESIERLRGRIKSQVVQMRESISNISNSNVTLDERIRQLFREQGITIASILTTIGMAISTLVLAVTGGGTGACTVTPPTPKPTLPKPDGVRDLVKKQLQTVANLLKQIASKAATALPGIIGSVISWTFKTSSQRRQWLAINLWTLFVALGGILLSCT